VIAAHAAGKLDLGEEPVHVHLRFFVDMPARASRVERERMRTGHRRPAHVDVGDIDNLAKAVLDALTGVVWSDDRQVVSLLAEKFFGEEPRTEIRLHRFV
jgi:Holliday junction resolvase RusA-like endonuclease